MKQRTVKGGKKRGKGRQKGAKGSKKGSKNAKGEPKGGQGMQTGSQSEAKGRPSCIQKRAWAPGSVNGLGPGRKINQKVGFAKISPELFGVIFLKKSSF